MDKNADERASLKMLSWLSDAVPMSETAWIMALHSLLFNRNWVLARAVIRKSFPALKEDMQLASPDKRLIRLDMLYGLLKGMKWDRARGIAAALNFLKVIA